MYSNFGQFIDGKWQPSSNNETYDVINPATEEIIGKASKASAADVDKALKSAQKAKVKRIVLTSSAVTMMGAIYDSSQDSGIVNAKNWTDPNSKNINTYIKSKTLAEKAAWDFFENQSDNSSIEMTVICPGGVFGPTLTGNIKGQSFFT